MIFGGIESIKKPEFDYNDFDASQKREDEYVAKIVAYVKEKSKGKYIGKELKISHADGHARYVVKSLKPLQLIHLDVGDAWHSPHVKRYTAKDVREDIDRTETFAEFWNAR